MRNFRAPDIKDVIFSTELDVRIYDINYGRHLGHDSLISLFHEARVRFLRSHGYSEANIEGIGILVTSLAVDYLREAFYGDQVIINMGADVIGKAGLDLVYQAINGQTGKELARGVTTVTFYDYREKKVAGIPTKFLSLLK